MTFRGDHLDELISASLTGDLTDVERAELDAHLAHCERCRATLAAFKSERRILSGLPVADSPRDLSARIRGGIEAGRFGVPWWRRPGRQVSILASAGVFAAVVLSVVYFGHLLPAPVGQASGSPVATVSSAPSSSASASTAPSAAPSGPPTFLAPGQLGYLELSGASLQPSKLSFINDATGASIDLGTVTGPPIGASLSPDGQWLAYITQTGETGANEVWAVHLTDGTVTPLGCSVAGPFTDRLAWNANSSDLAFTLTSVDLRSAGCPANDGKAGTTEPWLWQAGSNEPPVRSPRVGPDSYSAQLVGDYGFLVESHAGVTATTTTACVFCDQPPQQTVDGVFLPLLCPNGSRAIFWSGTMALSGGEWQFSTGGLPQLSGDLRSTGPASPWVGTPLFTDLVPYGGGAFAHGRFTWGPDSDLVAFWDGAWTGVPQSANGTYPSQQGVYVGRVSAGLLSNASRLPLTLDPNAWIVDVTFTPDGMAVVVTVGLPSAGIGDPPSAYLEIVPLDGSATRTIGGGVNPPPWDGPAVFGH